MSVRLSVRPSVTRRYSVETAKYIFKLSSLSDSDTTLVEIVQHQTVWQNSDGNPPPLSNGASNARGYEKTRDFRPISRFVSQTIQDRTIVTMEDD